VRLAVETSSGTSSIEIAIGASDALGALLDAANLPRRRFIVSTANVWRLHGHRMRGLTADEPVLLPDGERFKTLATVTRIYDALIRAAADRGTTLVVLGGGVAGDIAGFAAATYLRGVPLVQVPTTLLAQVDSAIGGKTGVNHPQGKNLIGAFHQPRLIVIDPQLLESLPRREFRAGLYEVVKYGVIASRALFERVAEELTPIFARAPESLMPVIAESCAIKARIVSADEKESGPRRALNFGHTVGHALEAVTKYRRFRHGEAIAYGMLVAADLAVRRGVFADDDRQALVALITKMGPLPAVSDLSATAVVEATRLDKKMVGGTLHFVLPASIGSTTIATDVSEAHIVESLATLGIRAL
jgi:3-dehydroquinate synthase